MKNLKNSILESLNNKTRRINENVNKNSILGKLEADINKAFYDESIDPDDAMDQINAAIYKLQGVFEKMRKKTENDAVIKKIYKSYIATGNDLEYYKRITEMLLDIMIDNIELIDIDLEEPFDNALQFYFYEDKEFLESAELENLCALGSEDEILGSEAIPEDYKDYFINAWMHLNDLCKIATGKALR